MDIKSIQGQLAEIFIKKHSEPNPSNGLSMPQCMKDLSLNKLSLIYLTERISKQEKTKFSWQTIISSLYSPSLSILPDFSKEEYEQKEVTTLDEDNSYLLNLSSTNRAQQGGQIITTNLHEASILLKKHKALKKLIENNLISEEKISEFLKELSSSIIKATTITPDQDALSHVLIVYFFHKKAEYINARELLTPERFIRTSTLIKSSLHSILESFRKDPEHSRYISHFILCFVDVLKFYELLASSSHKHFVKATLPNKKAIIQELYDIYFILSELNNIIKDNCSISSFLELKALEINFMQGLDSLSKAYLGDSYKLASSSPSIEILLELLTHYKLNKINYNKEEKGRLTLSLILLIQQIFYNSSQKINIDNISISIQKFLKNLHRNNGVFDRQSKDQIKRLSLALSVKKDTKTLLIDVKQKLGLYWDTLISLFKINDLDWHREHNCLKDINTVQAKDIIEKTNNYKISKHVQRIERAIWAFSLLCANNIITGGDNSKEQLLAKQANTRILNILFQYYIENKSIPEKAKKTALTQDEKRSIVVARINRAKAKSEEDTLLKEYQAAQRELIFIEARKRKSKLWAEMTARLNEMNFESHHVISSGPQGNAPQGAFSKGKKIVEVKLEEREIATKRKKKKKKSAAQKEFEASIELTHVNFASMSPKLKEQYAFLWTYASSPNKEMPFSVKDLLRFCNHFDIIKDAGFGKGDHYGLTLAGLGSYTISTDNEEKPTTVRNQSRCSKITIPIVKGSTRMNLNNDWHRYILENVSNALRNNGYPNPALIN